MRRKICQLSVSSPDLAAITQMREETCARSGADARLAGPVDRASGTAIAAVRADCLVVLERELLPDGRIMV
ncbi:hypothetical protein ACFSQT_15815 [Mesorhizobium calcicola]|uniref:Uncharacterized protein n=1 Tax=Mesorhizobium calcicola TaxID=1300310 RepID=A0ABW4WG53_9HYPH